MRTEICWQICGKKTASNLATFATHRSYSRIADSIGWWLVC